MEARKRVSKELFCISRTSHCLQKIRMVGHMNNTEVIAGRI